MQIDFTGISYDAAWHKHGDGKLHIRPYPRSLRNSVFRNGDLVVDGSEQYRAYNYALIGWEGLVDAKGKPLPFTDDSKKTIFDFRLGEDKDGICIADRVALVIAGLQDAKEIAEKN